MWKINLNCPSRKTGAEMIKKLGLEKEQQECSRKSNKK
jgi:hypothetical protein